MKIQIEFNSSYEATVTIDGRTLNLQSIPKEGFWHYTNLTGDDIDQTIGGIVATKLLNPLIDVLQGYSPDEESPDGDCWETWEKLTDSAADQIYADIQP